MTEKTLALLSVPTLAQINAELAKAYKATKEKDILETARLVYKVGCEKAGSEKEYNFHFELAAR